MQRAIDGRLSCRTSLERIAAESVTPLLSKFVHGDMSRHLVQEPPYRVTKRKGFHPFRRSSVNGCPLAALMVIASLHLEIRGRLLRGPRNRDELGRLQDSHSERGWNRRPVRHHQ